MSQQNPVSPAIVHLPVAAHTPTPFYGEIHEDDEDWIQHYERVAHHNGWTAEQCLQNLYFSLEGAARHWSKNHEASFTSRDFSVAKLQWTFATQHQRERTEDLLQNRTRGFCTKAKHGDLAAQLGETSCFLKAIEDIWFRCCSCSYFTRDQHGIVSHLVAHGDEQVKCHDPLSSSSRSKVHIDTQMQRGDRLSKCKLCPQAFADDDSLIQHSRTHTVKKPFKCKLCPLAFACSSHLNNHNRTHSGEKPFKCKLCPQAFARSSHLKDHNRTHSDEKPYKCRVCPQAFTLKSYLKLHNRTHSGEKPYKCKLCSQAFACTANLTQHKKLHTGEKPFKCKLCSHACARKSSLIRHNRTHTGEKPYLCMLCPQVFTTSYNLSRHNLTHC